MRMDTPHPAEEIKRTTLGAFTWRYLTGHHLDGEKRTDATWFKRGTTPIHHINWWTEKPRFHRMIWRWLIIALPAGWLAAVHYSPVIDANLTILLTLAFLPYMVHHVTMAFVRRVPRVRMIRVHERAEVPFDNTELDNLTIDDTEELDNVSSLPRKGRRS